GKKGKPFTFPDSFILVIGYIRYSFHLPYRQTEGIIQATGKRLPANPPIYGQICKRINKLNIDIKRDKRELVSVGRWGKTPLSIDVQSDSLRLSKTTSNSLITVTPNFEVILQTQSSEGRSLAFHLREFCNLQNKLNPNVDPVQIFSLTKESVVRSFRTGNYTWQKIVSLLTDTAYPSSIPENVKHELREWGEKYGEIKIKTIDVLDCKDEIIAETLLNDPVIRKQIITRVGKTTIEIKSGSRSQILSRCDKLGYFIKT
ncbi:MAG: transposase, partial [Nitrosopumilus sp.]|nr:transposase [Nitrosopumilus sp.]